MTDAATTAAPSAAGDGCGGGGELIYVGLVYGVYSTIRNQFGSAGGPTGVANAHAYGHAKVVIEIERFFGLYQERRIQDWYLALPHNGIIAFWNIYYGTAHFIVTAFTLIWLFRRDPERYPRWRNTLAFTTLLALIGFATFSLMPPRLLDAPERAYGPPVTAAAHHDGFVDTLADYGDVVVLRLRDVQGHLEPVRGDAEPAHRVVAVERVRPVPDGAAAVGEGARHPLPDRHVLLHRGHGEPLLARRRRGCGDLRRGLGDRDTRGCVLQRASRIGRP